jgi:hypothetical protein
VYHSAKLILVLRWLVTLCELLELCWVVEMCMGKAWRDLLEQCFFKLITT